MPIRPFRVDDTDPVIGLWRLGGRWARPSQDRRRAAAERRGVDGRL